MKHFFTLKPNQMIKKSLVCATLLGVVVLALASSGGGKKKSVSSNLGIIPIRTNGTLVDKSKPGYTGSVLFSTARQNNSIVYRSLVTYQKGNTTYIVPSQLRMNKAPKLSFSSPSLRSNLKVVDLKLKLCK